MGNEQSNERKPNWKIYKIIEKDNGDDWVRFGLNDYVTYENGNYKKIFFKKNGIFIKISDIGFEEGNYVRINLEETRYKNVHHDFKVSDGVMHKVAVSSSGNSSTSETAANLSDIGDVLQERQRFVASIEQSRHATNHAWTKQTSWDMPPGWK